MMDVTIAPDRIPSGTPAALEVRLTNGGPGACTNVVFTMRLPAGLALLEGKDRIERSVIMPGDSFISRIRVRAREAGRYELTSRSFSYRDHRGLSQHVTGFAAVIDATPMQANAPSPRLTVEVLNSDFPLGRWDVLRGRVTNDGDAEVSHLEVTISGQAITAERDRHFRMALLPAGTTADASFHICAREPGEAVPVHLDLAYRGPDGPHRTETTHTLRVGGDQVSDRQPTRILFLGANPPDTTRLRIDKELREIQQEIRLGKERDRFQIETSLAVRPHDISRALLEVEPHFVHFAGHGGGGEESFASEDDSGKAFVIPVAGLVELFEVAGESMRCVLVNACSTEHLARGLSSALPHAQVIGMRQPVGDRAAIQFSIGFYQAVAAGRPINDAFRLGRAQMRMMPEGPRPDFQAPLLLSDGG
jgi:CHAT domain